MADETVKNTTNDNNHFYFTSINCWTDGSGFEFDGEPDNLVGPSPSTEEFYSLTGRMAKNSLKGWSRWSNWIEKFQIDNRFLLLSDENAEAILYSNVDDPWMFTEYIFRGIGKKYNPDTETMEDIDCLVVEPPLYDEETLLLKNFDRQYPNETDFENFNEFDIKNECSKKYNKYQIVDGTNVYAKACRIVDENGWGYGYPVKDPGVKLFKISVNVESVKWGQHGNIPPHTLNMYAPSSWLDIKTKKVVQPVISAKVGRPVYANRKGVFYHADNNFDYVLNIKWSTALPETAVDSKSKFTYDIPTKEDINEDYIQTDGRNTRITEKALSSVKYIRQCDNGDIVSDDNAGCNFFNRSGGVCYCKLVAEDSTTEVKLIPKTCLFGTTSECPHFQINGLKAIAIYETVALDKDQYYQATYGMSSTDTAWASNLEKATSVMGGLGGGLGAFMGAAVLNTLSLNYKPGIKNYQQSNVFFETSFNIKDVPLEDYEITNGLSKGSQQTTQGVRVVRGSGNQIIDNIVPWQGGDNYAIGDADQVNFSYFTQSVMPCYNPAYCNELCGLAMQGGYKATSRANSQTEQDGNYGEFVDYCRYYKGKNKGVQCPFDSVPKTAYEFQEAQRLAKPELERTILMWISGFSNTIGYEKLVVEEKQTMFVEYKEEEKIKDEDNNTIDAPEHYILWSKSDESARFGGIDCSQIGEVTVCVPQPLKDNETEPTFEVKTITAYKVCKFTLTSINPKSASIKELFFWWTPLDNDGKKIEQYKGVPWFCKFDNSLSVSSHFTHYVDNWHKFIGGCHPHYKNYSKRGGEFMQELEETPKYERDMGDGDLGGEPEYAGAENPKAKVGYWIDEDGEWIMEEIELGESLREEGDDGTTRELHKVNANGEETSQSFNLTDKEYNSYMNRMERLGESGVMLSYKKSNTTISSNGETKSPVTINCAVYPNDTANLIEAIRFSPPVADDGSDKGKSAPPSVKRHSIMIDGEFVELSALPADRMGAHCKKCGYFLNEKYAVAHSESKAVCPWCKNELELIKISKMHKLKAIGQVDFWALPGTVIDSKSYFWKNPTFINNALIDQLEYKAFGNASNFNSGSELTNGYAKDFKGYYKPVLREDDQEYKELKKKNEIYKKEIDSKIAELNEKLKELGE